jgi:hypothetical protein
MAHPDEVVNVENEVPSKDVAAAELRHKQAESDEATPQEKKQAAVEQAHALSTRPQGSYAQLHETEEATLAVASAADVKEAQKAVDEAVEERDNPPAAKKAAAADKK